MTWVALLQSTTTIIELNVMDMDIGIHAKNTIPFHLHGEVVFPA